jgi:hypothetical protein
MERWRAVDESWSSKWSRGGSVLCSPEVTDSLHFNDEQDPDPHLSEKLDPDPQKSDADPIRNPATCLDLRILLPAERVVIISHI